MGQIHTIARLTEVPPDYKRPRCFTFIGLGKAFDSELGEVMEALDSKGVSTQFINILSELYKSFTTTSPFCNEIKVNLKTGHRQND